jgi:hypothetical protein
LKKYGVSDAITKVPFPFFCIVCGFFPLFVYFDGNKKSTTSLKGVSLGLSLVCLCVLTLCADDHSEKTVNVDAMWKDLCIDLLKAARTNGPLPVLSANALAPWMSPLTRNSPGMSVAHASASVLMQIGQTALTSPNRTDLTMTSSLRVPLTSSKVMMFSFTHDH